jgi:O-methyltransferase
MPFFAHLASDSGHSDVFNRAMASGAPARASTARGYDWSGVSVVADIGGGNGSLLGAVLDAQAHLRGVVFDLPHVVADARPVIEGAGLSDRCEMVGGDFFTDPLPSADVYVLAHILHDWDDERAVAILRNCRHSIGERGRLLVMEQVVPEGDEPSYAKLLDLIMLVLLGGRERTEAEWRGLLREGGFELANITPGAATSLIEAAPA